MNTEDWIQELCNTTVYSPQECGNLAERLRSLYKTYNCESGISDNLSAKLERLSRIDPRACKMLELDLDYRLSKETDNFSDVGMALMSYDEALGIVKNTKRFDYSGLPPLIELYTIKDYKGKSNLDKLKMLLSPLSLLHPLIGFYVFGPYISVTIDSLLPTSQRVKFIMNADRSLGEQNFKLFKDGLEKTFRSYGI